MSATTVEDTAPFEAPQDVTPVFRLALRDGAIALSALTLFGAADAWYSTTGLALAGLVAVLDGLGAGIVLGILSHEWGHFAGARLSGGIAPTTKLTSFFPLFVFDMEHNAPGPFRGMGVGGNLAHWLTVVVLAAALPLDTAGRVALVCGAFGFAVSASLTEIPVVRRAYAGASAAESFAGLTGEKLKHHRWIGAAAALALFLLL
jgi:hypothetical protein